MPRFSLFQQFDPQPAGKDADGTVWAANLLPCGEIEARDGDDALRQARQLSRFTLFNGTKLAGFPIVEAATFKDVG